LSSIRIPKSNGSQAIKRWLRSVRIFNRAKYCRECAARMKRKHATERKRKQRHLCHALGAEKAL
ncbi:hypothetical protein D3Z47_22000, partial [Lachnospiraceae bacterium]|nr:hypothetical protein [Lachnospiraceae bacterium]